MRIVFFSHYYPPEVNAPASRTSEHCRVWARAGHDVTVVTCAPNHPSGRIYPGYTNRLRQSEMIDGVHVVRVWTYLAANEGFARRTLNYLTFLFSASWALLRLPAPDVYVSTSPQFFCGLAGLVAKTVKRRPWVLEVRDLWPESIVTVGAMRKGLATRVLEWLERLAYRKADHIIAVTDSFVPHIAGRAQNAGKITVIKNGVDLNLFKPAERSEDLKAKFGLEGRFLAAYVGTHGMAHGLDTILDAADILRDEQGIGFLLVGDGAVRARLVERAAQMRLPNLLIAGQLPKSEMPAVWSATDVSLILLKKSETFTKVLPSKMFEAMAMGCPIVLGVEGEAKALLEQSGAGVAIAPESAAELADLVLKLSKDPGLCASLGHNGQDFVRTNFDRSALAKRYIEVIGSVAPDRARPQDVAHQNGADTPCAEPPKGT